MKNFSLIVKNKNNQLFLFLVLFAVMLSLMFITISIVISLDNNANALFVHAGAGAGGGAGSGEGEGEGEGEGCGNGESDDGDGEIPDGGTTCVPATGNTCTSASNICGQTNTGTIQCAGSCSVSAPPDSNCQPTATIFQSSGITTQGDPFTISWTTNASTNNCTVYTKAPGESIFSPWTTSVGGSSQVANLTEKGAHEFYSECSSGVGSAQSETIGHTVQTKQPNFNISPIIINEGDSVVITWECFFSASADGVGFSTGLGRDPVNPAGVVDNPVITTTYGLSCSNGGFAQQAVTVRIPTTGITAAPSLIQPEGTSLVTWLANNVNSCTVTGTDGFSDSSGDISGGGSWNSSTLTGPLLEQTVYTLSCVTSITTYEEKVIININPVFEEF